MLRPAEPSAHPSPVPPTSEARHTPGPWSLGHFRQNFGRGEQPIHVGRDSLNGGKGNCLAIVYLGGPGATNESRESIVANARLIAAAPALLAAAEAALPLLLLAAIKAPDRECAKRYSETCGVLTAAINAAKGGVA